MVWYQMMAQPTPPPFSLFIQVFTVLNLFTIACALLTAVAVLLSLIYMREKTRACASVS